MKRNRGTTLIEAITGAGVMMLLLLGTMSLFITGLASTARVTTYLTLSGKNAQGLRWISEYARGAMSATITNNGNQVNFTIPATSGAANAVTGEKEFTYPMASDGLTRGFKVDFTAGTMTDLHSNKILVKNIASTDLDPKSSNYNKAYQPFTFTSVGSRQAIVIQLITTDKVEGAVQYTRMKETVLLRNTSW